MPRPECVKLLFCGRIKINFDAFGCEKRAQFSIPLSYEGAEDDDDMREVWNGDFAGEEGPCFCERMLVSDAVDELENDCWMEWRFPVGTVTPPTTATEPTRGDTRDAEGEVPFGDRRTKSKDARLMHQTNATHLESAQS
jgi:hypothetical protein